jgi:3-deoxy-D-manno-octulosonic-acid transferase
VTASLMLYRIGTRLLEPLAPLLINDRVKKGKERAERVGERYGRSTTPRPAGPLLWMHGASVGESKLLLDLFQAVHDQRPDAHAVVTTQTTTSADMIAAKTPPGVIHHMAPVDGPGAVKRFLHHWQPKGAVFAEGEIWPNMLLGLQRAKIPAVLANARMTEKSLTSWNSRKASARKLFDTFGFIGAADRQTAIGLASATGRAIPTVGNLKMAVTVKPAPAEKIQAFRAGLARPILLAASTHPGEDEFALTAFAEARKALPKALLVIVPRHPDRGSAIVDLVRQRGFAVQQWSKETNSPPSAIDVLVADTIGELVFWYGVADSVYLGGATRPGIGGHNAIEPAQLGKRVFTGPHGFNFLETFTTLAAANALIIGTQAEELAAYWRSELTTRQPPVSSDKLFTAFREPFEQTVSAIVSMLPPAGSKASADA